MSDWDRAETERVLSERLGMRVVISDAVPEWVWGYVGDFAAAFDPPEVDGVSAAEAGARLSAAIKPLGVSFRPESRGESSP